MERRLDFIKVKYIDMFEGEILMSTRTTKALIEKDDLSIYLYHEMHDELWHLELEWENGLNSYVNVPIPKDMGKILARVLDKPS